MTNPAEALRQRIQEHVPVVSFGPPCTAAEIARAEGEIGQALPAFLRELYLACDGFRGPTGSLLWPLFGDNGLVGYNLFVRMDRDVPAFVRRVIFFGDDGIGGTVGTVSAVDPARPDRILDWCVNESEPAVLRRMYLNSGARASRNTTSMWERGAGDRR